MSNFGIIFDVPCTATVAYYTCDQLGNLRCLRCDPQLIRDETGRPRELMSESEVWANCSICGLSPWEARVEVPASTTVEYVACKIF